MWVLATWPHPASQDTCHSPSDLYFQIPVKGGRNLPLRNQIEDFPCNAQVQSLFRELGSYMLCGTGKKRKKKKPKQIHMRKREVWKRKQIHKNRNIDIWDPTAQLLYSETHQLSNHGHPQVCSQCFIPKLEQLRIKRHLKRSLQCQREKN